MTIASTKEVATFWHGPPLSALDVACLMTFVRFGFAVTVYSYDPLPGLPAALRRGDAQQVVDRRFLSGFRFMGKPSFSHFSDLFRYRLFQQTGMTWIDADLLALRDFSIPATGNLVAKETPTGINGAIMRIDPADPRLAELIRLTEEIAVSTHFKWGASGPGLITSVFGPGVVADASGIDRFYPIGYEEWWRPFLPEFHDWCVERCTATDALHLWNNIVEKAGYWKDLAPPSGSFIHETLKRYDLLHGFAATCPVNVMEQLRTNYINSRTGAHFRLAELSGMTMERVGAVVRRRIARAKP
jgi:hypothetical protein